MWGRHTLPQLRLPNACTCIDSAAARPSSQHAMHACMHARIASVTTFPLGSSPSLPIHIHSTIYSPGFPQLLRPAPKTSLDG